MFAVMCIEQLSAICQLQLSLLIVYTSICALLRFIWCCAWCSINRIGLGDCDYRSMVKHEGVIVHVARCIIGPTSTAVSL